MVPVARRDAATLIPIIIEHIAAGTWIISDGWASYGGIRNLQDMHNGQLVQKYQHRAVIHQYVLQMSFSITYHFYLE